VTAASLVLLVNSRGRAANLNHGRQRRPGPRLHRERPHQGDSGADLADERTRLLDDPLWASVPAVAAGRLCVVETSTWINVGPTSMNAMFDDLARCFA
jgi:hypothetical protein